MRTVNRPDKLLLGNPKKLVEKFAIIFYKVQGEL